MTFTISYPCDSALFDFYDFIAMDWLRRLPCHCLSIYTL